MRCINELHAERLSEKTSNFWGSDSLNLRGNRKRWDRRILSAYTVGHKSNRMYKFAEVPKITNEAWIRKLRSTIA